LLRALETPAEPRVLAPTLPDLDEEARENIVALALRGIVADGASSAHALPVLFQDFQLRCRMHGLPGQPLDLPTFRIRLAMAKAGIEGEGWDQALALGATLPDDMLPVFLLLARAARQGVPCPSDAELAAIYGTTSLGRLRRVLAYMEEQNIVAARTDLSGRRSLALPALGWTTAPAEAEAEAPGPARRTSRRS
jgi:hypothetical protein